LGRFKKICYKHLNEMKNIDINNYLKELEKIYLQAKYDFKYDINRIRKN
jgi:hypothetical protein